MVVSKSKNRNALSFTKLGPSHTWLASGNIEFFHTFQTGRTRCTQLLCIDSRRPMSKILHVLNVRPRINRGVAVGAALTAQFQHP